MSYLTNNATQIGIAQDENGNPIDILRTFADPASSGDNVLVAASSGKRIRVFAAILTNNVATAQNLRFRSATNSISPLMVFGAVANGYLPLAHNPHGWFQTNVGEALNLNLSAATAVGVQVTYALV